MKRMRAFLNWVGDTFEHCLVYLSLLAGVMFNLYGPILSTGALPKLEPGRWIVGGIMSFGVIWLREQLPNKKDAALVTGRRKNLKWRMLESLMAGITAQEVLSTFAPVFSKMFG